MNIPVIGFRSDMKRKRVAVFYFAFKIDIFRGMDFFGRGRAFDDIDGSGRRNFERLAARNVEAVQTRKGIGGTAGRYFSGTVEAEERRFAAIVLAGSRWDGRIEDDPAGVDGLELRCFGSNGDRASFSGSRISKEPWCIHRY